jgi:hypothetical protein
MDMQDKEFDRLFNSKLGEFEMEPSPRVWDNIADELHGKKAKRSIVPYLSIAASVIILASASILFFNQTESTYVKPVKQNKVVAKNEEPTNVATVGKTDAVPVITDNPVQELAVVNHPTQTSPAAVNTTAATQNTDEIKPKATVTEPVQTSQPVLAAITQPTQVIEAVVPGKETPLSVKTEQVIIEKTTTVMAAAPAKEPVKKRGIHSLGGLINVLVAKVDKREDKFIEFTDDEENGSNVTGVNLGILKIKKQ